jgi:hypothetical protein
MENHFSIGEEDLENQVGVCSSDVGTEKIEPLINNRFMHAMAARSPVTPLRRNDRLLL